MSPLCVGRSMTKVLVSVDFGCIFLIVFMVISPLPAFRNTPLETLCCQLDNGRLEEKSFLFLFSFFDFFIEAEVVIWNGDLGAVL